MWWPWIHKAQDMYKINKLTRCRQRCPSSRSSCTRHPTFPGWEQLAEVSGALSSLMVAPKSTPRACSLVSCTDKSLGQPGLSRGARPPWLKRQSPLSCSSRRRAGPRSESNPRMRRLNRPSSLISLRPRTFHRMTENSPSEKEQTSTLCMRSRANFSIYMSRYQNIQHFPTMADAGSLHQRTTEIKAFVVCAIHHSPWQLGRVWAENRERIMSKPALKRWEGTSTYFEGIWQRLTAEFYLSHRQTGQPIIWIKTITPFTETARVAYLLGGVTASHANAKQSPLLYHRRRRNP